MCVFEINVSLQPKRMLKNVIRHVITVISNTYFCTMLAFYGMLLFIVMSTHAFQNDDNEKNNKNNNKQINKKHS